MLATLDAIVDRIVTGYAPERIIVFGSHASGEAREGSDVDLLIVKETNQRPLERRLAVERLLADRGVPLDLFVYTPAEVRRLYAAGSPLIEEIVENGRVLYMRKATEAWLTEARDEMESASILLEHGKYRGACLHSQQCVEEALKALILERGKRPMRTHDVVELLNTARADGWQIELTMDDAVYLNSIYRGRYPTEEGLLPHGEPSDEDAGRAVRVAARSLGNIEFLLTSSTL
jgi:HEPN domain-containing protein/predicted nucleotidyltransferase